LLCRDSLKHFFPCVGCIDRHRQGISTTLSWVTNAFFRVEINKVSIHQSLLYILFYESSNSVTVQKRFDTWCPESTEALSFRNSFKFPRVDVFH
jgi:hypothetical protein